MNARLHLKHNLHENGRQQRAKARQPHSQLCGLVCISTPSATEDAPSLGIEDTLYAMHPRLILNARFPVNAGKSSVPERTLAQLAPSLASNASFRPLENEPNEIQLPSPLARMYTRRVGLPQMDIDRMLVMSSRLP